MSRRAVRLILVPAILFVVVSGTVFTLAQLHPAKNEAEPVSAGTGVSGSADERGHALFAERCARCHDTGVGPPLAGRRVSLSAARAQIENGGGGMPADLVTGRDLEDVLAYLETILAR